MKRTIGFLLGWLFLSSMANHLSAQKRPNIIIFLADDLNQQDVGCYGNKDVHTPNMDQLAKEGMRFNRAYAASSMCSPSRSALFTGLYPYRNGSQMNHFTTRPEIGNLPQFLHKLGYRVVISGKIDVSPLDNFPFEVIGKEFGKYLPVENRVDRKKESVHMIQSHFATHSDQPLCLIVAPWLPHVPWFPHKDFDPNKIKVPAYLADTKETRGAISSYYQSIAAADKMLGEVLDAVDKAGQTDNTVMLFTSDQGAQFPGAKWTVYNKGLNVPLIVRWPGKVATGTTSDALVSLVDITPTFIDLAGGNPIDSLDGISFKDIMEGDHTKSHHDYVFAETSVEPQYWYNYTPSRSVIGIDGWHYIRNYHPGRRFITHIDKVEQNEYYFASWMKDAKTNPKTKFLLDRYSYRPPEELYNINQDPEEFKNLAGENNPVAGKQLQAKRRLLTKELARQGETKKMIMSGGLPHFFDNGYMIAQNNSASNLSFNRHKWNPDTLLITAYLQDIDKGGIICDYFGHFKLFAYKSKIGVKLADGTILESPQLDRRNGHILLRLTANGALAIEFNEKPVLNNSLGKDLTKIKGGYVTCGKVQGRILKGRLQPYSGKITDLAFTMNALSTSP